MKNAPLTYHELQETIARLEQAFAVQIMKEVKKTSLRTVAASYGFPNHIWLWRFLRRVLPKETKP
jgi:hypothetical protein